METLCDQLCVEMDTLVEISNLMLTTNIMKTIHKDIEGCDRKTYIWIFTHATALGMQINEAMNGEDPLPGERWAEFINNNIRIH